MWGKECYLCGGSIDHRGICSECGADNKNPGIRKTAAVNSNTVKSREPYHRKSTKKNTEKKSKNIVKFVSVIGVIILSLGTALEVWDSFGTEIKSFFESENPDKYTRKIDDETYDYVSKELSEDGKSYKISLGPGEYRVGINIPEGTYKAEVTDGEINFAVEDEDNGISLSWSFTRDESWLDADENAAKKLENIRLYQGALIKLDNGDAKLQLKSENAQLDKIEAYKNPLTETLEIKGKATTGADFMPGVYDVSVQGCQFIEYIIYEDKTHTDIEEEKSIYLDNNMGDGDTYTYRNVVFPKNTVISLEDGNVPVTLTPSEVISMSDYEKCYE